MKFIEIDKVSEKKLKNNEYMRVYKLNNHDKTTEIHRRGQRKYRKTLKGRFDKYKYGAKIRNLNFELSFELFSQIFNSNCHYCGKEMAHGVDRVDSGRGYSTDNVVACCKTCNYMKMAMSYSDFVCQIEKIFKNIKN